MSRRFVLSGLLVTIANLVAACGGAPAAPQGVPPPRLGVFTAVQRPVERTLEVSGTVRGHNTAILTSRIVAGLREVRVRAGDRVRAGQLHT